MTSTRKENLLLGVVYMLAGTIFLSIGDAMGKWLTEDYPVIQISWLRSLSGLILIGLFALLTGRLQQLKTRRPGWHLLRSFLSTGTVFFIFYALKYIPIAEYVSLTFAAPFILAVLSPLVLKEKVSRQSWIAIVFGFIGVLIILRPTPDHFHIGHLAAFSVAFSIAALGITARYLSNTESNIALNFYLYPINAFFGAFWALDVWVMPNLTDWLLFFTFGTMATIALGCFIKSVSLAAPSKVIPIDYARMVWMLLLGYFIWNEIPSGLTWIGIIIIIVSGIYVVTHGKKIPELEATKETKTGGL